MPHVAIILIHYNSPHETVACIESLAAMNTSTVSWKVWILDNASKEAFALPQRLKKVPHSLIRSESNLGFTGGNNMVMETVLANETERPDFFLLLNTDTHVDPLFLNQLVSYAQTHPQAGAVAPKIYFTAQNEFHRDSYFEKERGKVIWFAGGVLDWADVAAFHKNVDEVDYGHIQKAGTTDFTTGCCMLVPTSIIESVGMLNERLFLYWEDTEWCLRIQTAGYECHYCPDAVIWHDNGGSTDGSGSEMQVYYQTRNQIWMALRYGSQRAKLAVMHLAWKYLHGKTIQRRALFDAILGRMGKHVLL